MKCETCPFNKINSEISCDGERHNRYCELTNPHHIHYKYEYIELLLNKKGIDSRVSLGFIANIANDFCNDVITHLNTSTYYFHALSTEYEKIIQKCSLVCVHNTQDDSNFVKKNNSTRFVLLYDKTQNIENVRDYQGVIVKDKDLIKDFPEDIQENVFVFNGNDLNSYLHYIISAKKNQFTKMPNLLEKLTNFVKAETKHAFVGFTKTPEPIIKERLDKCYSCIYLTEKKECSLCGCPVIEKTKVPTEKCPHGFWMSYELKQSSGGGCGCKK